MLAYDDSLYFVYRYVPRHRPKPRKEWTRWRRYRQRSRPQVPLLPISIARYMSLTVTVPKRFFFTFTFIQYRPSPISSPSFPTNSIITHLRITHFILFYSSPLLYPRPHPQRQDRLLTETHTPPPTPALPGFSLSCLAWPGFARRLFLPFLSHRGF